MSNRPHPSCTEPDCSHPGPDGTHECNGKNGMGPVCGCDCHHYYDDLLHTARRSRDMHFDMLQDTEDKLDRIPRWVLWLFGVKHSRQTTLTRFR